MKKIYADEKWCLGCHLCEYYCAFANSSDKSNNMCISLKNLVINPNVKVEENNKISFALQCRQCNDPLCVKSCLANAIKKDQDGIIHIDNKRCVQCYTCILVCPYGAISISDNGIVMKCELCTNNKYGTPLCVKKCPNGAIKYEER